MEIVDKVIQQIKNKLNGRRFDDQLLDTVTAMLQRHGYGAAKLVALGEDDELVKVLEIMQEYNITIQNACIILQHLNAIVTM